MESDQFMPWMRYPNYCGILLCVITGAGIMLYYRKGIGHEVSRFAAGADI